MDTIIMLIIFIILASIGFWAVDGCYKLNEKEGREKEMKKIYKGYELLKAIADGEIKERDKIYLVAPKNKIELFWKYGNLYKKVKDINSEKDKEIDMFDIMNYKFELIEDKTIDIESIEEIKPLLNCRISEGRLLEEELSEEQCKINKLVQAVKQLNKEIKSIKEK